METIEDDVQFDLDCLDKFKVEVRGISHKQRSNANQKAVPVQLYPR